TTGFAFILAIIALPLGLFLVFGWIEMVRNLATFRRWLPALRFPRFKRTLAVSLWRQLDVAYVPYLLCLGILVAALVVDAPAKYAPLHEYDLPDGHTKVEAYVPGPDQHLWLVSRYFNVTSSRSAVTTTEHY